MKQKMILVFLSIILASASVSAIDYSNCPMGGGYVGGYGNMMSGSYGTSAMLVSWLIGALFVVALVLAIIWLVKQIGKKK